VSHVTLRTITANGLRISVRQWGLAGGKPLVLIPGGGLAAALFEDVEKALADRWRGYTIDRRGQGQSDKPADAYEWTDFASDLIGVAGELGLAGAIGIGHSAGGTDLLLAAARQPDHWARIAAIEPTVQDSRLPPEPETDPPSWREGFERSIRRRAVFDSLEHAVERFMTNPGFARCDAGRVRRYLEQALERGEDGTWRLLCTPAIEGSMNRRIMQAMNHRYRTPDGEDPFVSLLGLAVPATILTTGHSGDIYRAMGKIAVEVIPGARHQHLPGLGHMVPLESPETVVALAHALADGE
jgi:pimeloyl-ACP methyl ester carboxylesterase